MHKPYISFICTGRNDDWGGNRFKRTQVFVTALLGQIERCELDSELIFVEWNPVPDKPKLWQALDWPKELRHCSVRVVEVSPEIHNTIETADKISLYVILAFNVGARRARGEFFLSMSQDVIFSNELMDFLAQRELNPNKVYRIDRQDVLGEVPYPESLDNQIEYCYNSMYLGHCHPDEKTPHTNAAGDFMLMSRELWYKVKGFPETAFYGVYIDGLMVYMAFYAGDGQIVLRSPMTLFHMDHENSWMIKGEEALIEKGIPYMSYETYSDLHKKIRSGKISPAFNKDHWGLRDLDLAEHHIGGPI